MPRSAKEIEAGLLRKGFKRRESKDAYFHFWNGGRKTPIYTKMSHGEKDIHDGLLSAMARQVKLGRRQFDELVDCPMSLEQYQVVLKTNGHI